MSDDLEKERLEICRSIGQRIKTIRKQRHLTLGDVAAKVGFSRSYLSQIENLKREPSIGTLIKIAHVLGVEALFLITGGSSDAGQEEDISIVRQEERKIMPDAFRHLNFKYQSLAHKKKDRLMDAYIIEAGFDFPKHSKPWHGESFFFVLEGTHEVMYEGKSYILNKGDACYINSSKPNMGRSLGSKPSKLLLVFTLSRPDEESEASSKMLPDDQSESSRPGILT
ncbi:MAG: helix-turn-helix transcriptional regulator [Deltaproteobacteria bacterium]|nr:helix-turn-helix transcriptional regulator [Deltaproteobacteria bacterium]